GSARAHRFMKSSILRGIQLATEWLQRAAPFALTSLASRAVALIGSPVAPLREPLGEQPCEYCVGALAALLIAAAVTVAAAAVVVAMTVMDAPPAQPNQMPGDWSPRTESGLLRGAAAERGAVLAGTPAPTSTPNATPQPTPSAEVAGIGSNYPGTAGWIGQATVALPLISAVPTPVK
ncbi:MAG: hypothetical protein ACR2GO_04470, partial [Candidatus Limnocylindria bacterium]